MSTQTVDARQARPSLSGELSDLLIEFAAGLQRACVYGPRHPAVTEAAESFVARNSGRRRDRGTLSIAAAGGHLIVELRSATQLIRRLSGVATGLEHPLLGALAERLSAHEVFAIDIAEGVTSQETAAILCFLATDPAKTNRPLGREDDEALAALPNLRIHRGSSGPLRAPTDPEEDARLWTALARTALAIPETYEDRPYSAAEVASAISARAGNPEFQSRVADGVGKIATHLGKAGPLESLDLARAFSDLFRQLDGDTLRILLSMSGDEGLRARLLHDVAGSLDVDVVLELIRAAAEDEVNDISRWMLRLLTKLARHADTESGATATLSDAALREQIRELVSGWELENPNPEDYEESLVRSMTSSDRSAEADATRLGAEVTRVAAAQIVTIALEAGIDAPPVWRAVDEMIQERRISELADKLANARDPGLAERVWDRLADRPVLQWLVQEEEPDWEVLDQILPRAGLAAADPLLDRLMAAESLTVRRRLFDRLVGLGPGVGEPAVRCLGRPQETPWYVLRNVLSLLAMLDSWPADFDPWRLTEHPNAQVRLEAIKICLRAPEMREAAIVNALGDPTSRIVALGIVEAENGCPAEAQSHLLDIAVAGDEGEFSEFRSHAIRALTCLGSDRAREALLQITALRRRGLRRSLPDPTPALLAAIRGLATSWPEDPRVQEVIGIARDSKDPGIRQAAS